MRIAVGIDVAKEVHWVTAVDDQGEIRIDRKLDNTPTAITALIAEPLVKAGKLGCVLFQFPHWFTAKRAHIRYLEQLQERSHCPIAIEFRGGGWMTDNYRAKTLSLLERLGFAYVVDKPQGFRSSAPPVVAATSPLAVVRFHGHNAETYEKPNISAAERFRYLYTEEELKGWVAPVRRLAEKRTGCTCR